MKHFFDKLNRHSCKKALCPKQEQHAKRSFGSIMQRFTALLLTAILFISGFPLSALASYQEKTDSIVLSTKDGTSVAEDASWAETFPYGTFAFENYQSSGVEGETHSIKVYRLGGTQGRATVGILYQPAVANIDDKKVSNLMALSKNDLELWIEDTLPIAKYQPVGREPDPLAPPVQVDVQLIAPQPGSESSASTGSAAASSSSSEVPATGSDSEASSSDSSSESTAVPADYQVSLSIDADAYQWYTQIDGTDFWEEITDATSKALPVSAEDYNSGIFDFRCVYTVDNLKYCSRSLKGTDYVYPEQEQIPVIPEGFVNSTETTFSMLDMTSEDIFSGYYFTLTFADGEWVKEIQLRTADDDISEAMEFATFTLAECYGGVLYDSASTLSVQVNDNEPPQPATLCFEISEITADKSDGEAVLTVKRTGGFQQAISVKYNTADGSAKADIDYQKSQGELFFYGDIDTHEIRIPLINNNEKSTEGLKFTVELSELKGDTAGICSIEGSGAIVNLINSNTAEKTNIATMLASPDAVNLQNIITVSDEPVAKNTETVTAVEQNENNDVVANISTGGNRFLRSFIYPGAIKLTRGSDYSGWSDILSVSPSLNNSSLGFGGYTWSVNGGSLSSTPGWSWNYSNKGKGNATVNIPYMGRWFKSFTGTVNWKPNFGVGPFSLQYTYPVMQVNDGSKTAYFSCNARNVGKWPNYQLAYTRISNVSHEWELNNSANGYITLGVEKYDYQNSTSPSEAKLSMSHLERRYFNNDLNLRIYTANDKEGLSWGENEKVTILEPESPLYNSLKPTVTLDTANGGITESGKIYVGSKLRVELSGLNSSYKPAQADGQLDSAVYLSNEDGSVHIKGEGSDGTYTFAMDWSNMSAAQLNDKYYVNVVMQRKQSINLDLSPSIPRLIDENGVETSQIDPSRVNEAVDKFWKNASITYGYSVLNQAENKSYYSYDDASVGSSLGGASLTDVFVSKPNEIGEYVSKDIFTDIQWVCFNLPSDDLITYNKRSYAGNERIYIEEGDLSSANLSFAYYSSDMKDKLNVMNAKVQSVRIYLDDNANGKIDGYFDETSNEFILEKNPDGTEKDSLIRQLALDSDYDISDFAPYIDEKGVSHQFFAKVFYRLTPRCLIVPAGASENDRVQILPAFVTKITNNDSYAALSEEQKQYRYIISGKTTYANGMPAQYSSDNHLMYTAAAGAVSYVDVPLGGDINPPKLNDDKETYSWSPDYKGNLLFPFEDPKPITVPNSMAGKDISIAPITGFDADGKAVFADSLSAKNKLNGYLGSLTENDTIMLCVREQTQTMQEILQQGKQTFNVYSMLRTGSGDQPEKEMKIESVGGAGVGTYPDPSANMSMDMDESETPKAPDANMDSSPNKFSEFNMDFGTDLPSLDIGLGDTVSIITDGYQVGFSIGLPLGGKIINPADGTENDGKKSMVGVYKDYADQMGKLKDWMKKPSKAALGDADETYGDAMGGKTKSKGSEVSFSISLAFMFEYNPLDNGYYFKEFTVALGATLQFRAQARFTPLPIIYVYIQLGLDIEISTGLSVERTAVKEETPYYKGGSLTLKKGQSIVVDTQYKAMDISFNGTINMSAYKNAGGDSLLKPSGVGEHKLSNEDTGFVKGSISSTGEKAKTLVLYKQDGMTFDKNEHRYILLQAVSDEVTITNITRLTDIGDNKVMWNGMTIAPTVYMEAGIGVGVELMKIEFFCKISIGIQLSFGKDSGDGVVPFTFDEFAFTMGAGLRVVFLFFNFELDLISYTVSMDEDYKWKTSWSALNGGFGGESEISTYGLLDNGSPPDSGSVKVSMPKSYGDSQQIYFPEGQPVMARAYLPTGGNVPFMLSGYGSSSDAFKLIDGLGTGYDYEVVTIGGENYVIYALSRGEYDYSKGKTIFPVDYSALALSRLKLINESGTDSYGLVNPVDATSLQNYILLDDELGGDLDFTAWADGDKLRVSWVTYKQESAEPAEPAYDVPKGKDGNNMAADNYKNSDNFAASVKPTEPTKVEETANPDDAGLGKPKAPVEPTKWTEPPSGGKIAAIPALKTAGSSYGDILKAYNEKLAAYNENLTAYNNDPNEESYNTVKASFDTLSPEYANVKKEYDSAKTAYDLYIKYQQALKDYENALKNHEAYIAWFEYFKQIEQLSEFGQRKMVSASRNTVLKTTDFTPDDKQSGIKGEVKTLAEDQNAYLCLPGSDIDGKLQFAVMANNFTDEDEEKAAKAYDTYLKIYYPDEGEEAERLSNKAIRDMQSSQQKNMRDLMGKNSSLLISAKTNDGTAKLHTIPLSAGETVENIEISSLADGYMLAYTTGSLNYATDKDGTNVVDATADLSSYAYVDTVTTHRMYLRKITVNDAGEIIADTPNLISSLVDYGQNNSLDGMPGSGTKYEDPNFSNLQFLKGKLTADALETFLLFDMNGSTYYFDQNSLSAILNNNPSGAVMTLFFGPKTSLGENGEKVSDSSTGKLSSTIGSDGEGNLSAVYISSVPQSQNNALYLSKYDSLQGKWGAGAMLAMNYMQVYEDSISKGYTSEETEAAYLDTAKGGGMDQFTFSNIKIALGQLEHSTDDIGALSTTKNTLLVLTQGNMKYLTSSVGADGQTQLRAMTDAEQALAQGEPQRANRKPGTGLYAISYGIGSQSIGLGSIKFLDYNFSAGKTLKPTISFTNTGDVSIRASKDNPATVKLFVTSPKKELDETVWSTTELASWSIYENILSGQAASFGGTSIPLAESLPVGSVFYISVSEDTDYSGTAFVANTLRENADGTKSGLLTVEEKSELGFESMDITTRGIDENGNTLLNVSMLVGNRGGAETDSSYIQFSYQSGTDQNGKAVFSPIDLTISGTELKVAQQKELVSLFRMPSINKQNGILELKDDTGSSTLSSNYGRTVSGTIAIPNSYYTANERSSLNLRVQLYNQTDWSNADYDAGMMITTGKPSSEYDTNNNVRELQLERVTSFDASTKISIALGNTLRIPVNVSANTEQTPVIQVEEIPDDAQHGNNLGILYYLDTSAYTKGHQTGTLVLAPIKEGSGIIHIKDVNTNTIYPIAYTVTPYTDGINISKDVDMFKYINADLSAYEDGKANQDWSFLNGVSLWDSTKNEPPYLNDIAKGIKGAAMSFNTVAESIRLYFIGKIRIESTYPNFKPIELTATSASPYADIEIGENSESLSSNVKITVLSSNAQFDRLVETYASGNVPTPSDDSTAPSIYWSRLFPQTASILMESDGTVSEANKIKLSCFAIDDGGIASITVRQNGNVFNVDPARDNLLWSCPITIDKNGPLTVTATDLTGNQTVRTINVDWFSTKLSIGTESTTEQQSFDMEFVDSKGLPIDDRFIQSGEKAFLKVTPKRENANLSVSYISSVINEENESSLQAVELSAVAPSDIPQSRAVISSVYYPAEHNGYYQIKCTDSELVSEFWTSKISSFNRIDASVPQIKLKFDAESSSLLFSVYKDTAARSTVSPISKVSINGYSIENVSGNISVNGTFPILYGGEYVVETSDEAGNINTSKIQIPSVKIKASDNNLQIGDVWLQKEDNGSISLTNGTANPITGGSYSSSLTEADKAANKYSGSYEFTVIPADEKLEEDKAVWGTSAVTNLASGEYKVYIRSAEDKANTSIYGVLNATVNNTRAGFKAASTGTSGQSGTITVTPNGGRYNTDRYLVGLLKSEENADKLSWDKIEGLKQPMQWSVLKQGDINMLWGSLAYGSYIVGVREIPQGVDTVVFDNAVAALSNAQSKLKEAQANASQTSVSETANIKIEQLQDLLSAWDNADESEKPAKEQEYKNAIASNADILKALSDMQSAPPENYDEAQKQYNAAVREYYLDMAQADADANILLAENEIKAKQQDLELQQEALLQSVNIAYSANSNELWDNAYKANVAVSYNPLDFIVEVITGGSSNKPKTTISRLNKGNTASETSTDDAGISDNGKNDSDSGSGLENGDEANNTNPEHNTKNRAVAATVIIIVVFGAGLSAYLFIAFKKKRSSDK